MSSKSPYVFTFEPLAIASEVVPESLSGALAEKLSQLLGDLYNPDEYLDRLTKFGMACYGQGLADSTIPEIRASLDELVREGRLTPIEPLQEDDDDADSN